MKKYIFLCTLLMTLLLNACQGEQAITDEVVPENSKEANVIFSVNIPDLPFQTKAASNPNSAYGGLSNVDLETQYDLRYRVAIYRVETGGTNLVAIAPFTKVTNTYQPITFALKLTPNRNYKAIIWADYVLTGQMNDLHYDTTGFPEIAYNNPTNTAILNDESRDAYWGTKDFVVATDVVATSVELKRPFAKLRIVTTDWETITSNKPNTFKVTYYGCQRFTSINLLDNNAVGTTLPNAAGTTTYTGTVDLAQREYSKGYDATDNNRTVVVDYLMTPPSGQTPIKLVFEALDGTNSVVRYSLKTNLPIQRNWLTTVLGNMLLNTGRTVEYTSLTTP